MAAYIGNRLPKVTGIKVRDWEDFARMVSVLLRSKAQVQAPERTAAAYTEHYRG